MGSGISKDTTTADPKHHHGSGKVSNESSLKTGLKALLQKFPLIKTDIMFCQNLISSPISYMTSIIIYH